MPTITSHSIKGYSLKNILGLHKSLEKLLESKNEVVTLGITMTPMVGYRVIVQPRSKEEKTFGPFSNYQFRAILESLEFPNDQIRQIMEKAKGDCFNRTEIAIRAIL